MGLNGLLVSYELCIWELERIVKGGTFIFCLITNSRADEGGYTYAVELNDRADHAGAQSSHLTRRYVERHLFLMRASSSIDSGMKEQNQGN
jgi:hypothetical protein